MATFRWQTDVEAILDLLSRHLYPRHLSYLRELVSNAVDATLLSDAVDRRVSVSLRDGWLVVDDNGRGLHPSDVGLTIGRIGLSGTAALTSGQQGGPPPIGAFGVGLLSARVVAQRIVIRSRSRRDGRGIRLSWDGGATFDWEPDDRRSDSGTSVAVQLRPEEAETLTTSRLTRFLTRHMPHVPVRIDVDGIPVGDPRTPWRDPRRNVTEWARASGMDDVLTAHMKSDARSSTVIVGIPDATATTEPAFCIYRSGVLVPGLDRTTIPAAHRWLPLLADLPWLPVTLDREGPTEDGRSAASQAITALLDLALLDLLDVLTSHPLAPGWWAEHRAQLIGTVAHLIRVVPEHLDARQLAAWIPFRSTTGPLTLTELLTENRGRIAFCFCSQRDARVPASIDEGRQVIVLEDTDEQDVLVYLARAGGFALEQWSRGGTDATTPADLRYPPEVLAFARALDQRLSAQGIAVRIDETFRGPHGLAEWLHRPTWLATPHESVYDPRWFDPVVTHTMTGQPTLGLNPWSPVVQSLARTCDPSLTGALGGLLAELASVQTLGPNIASTRRLYRRLLETLCRLGEIDPPPISSPRFFVAYDWTRDRDAFDAVCEVLTAPPFDWELVHPLDEQSERYILENIGACLRQAHVIVSILSVEHGSCSANANVLFEAGMAEGIGGRVHLVCHRRGTRPMSDIEGLLRIEYEDAHSLRHSLQRGLKARGLDSLVAPPDRSPTMRQLPGPPS